MAKTVEITSLPVTSRIRIFEVEQHSFINLLNVIHAQLELISLMAGQPVLLTPVFKKIKSMADAIRREDRKRFSTYALKELKKEVQDTLSKLESKNASLLQQEDYTEYKSTFKEIFRVLDQRVVELEDRLTQPDEWKEISIESFRADIVHFLGAIEKNSRGRYRIVYNIAEQEKSDYLVHASIDSDLGERIVIPLLVKDSIRDLIANARKYTPPGGKIDIGLTVQEGRLRFVINDNGVGIPSEEIEHVVGYGYRASNVMDEIRTMGSGLGLTKAHYVVHRFGGRLWINSDAGKGTTITFDIPLPDPFSSRADHN